ncbi:class III extradiol dioxygenase subunit B-like domain-containing protein [Nonomuraea antimicrobica]|uniref:Class III extradiol dioxygenase subunit B-like domain-containing protein n=1 Tax=Nonomuraea antimicrobica TaxID=561173 RepID=A0ABP7DHW8_9ACTN
MLVAAAVCPPTPLVVLGMPDLRSACHTAISTLREARPDRLVVVGGADTTTAYDGGATGTLRPWGLDHTSGTGEPVLPLSLTVARVLLGDHPCDGLQSVAFDAASEECRAVGEGLATGGESVALLVMADGSACLSPRAPGRYDEAAGPFNDLIAKALATGDPAVLAGLDPVQADRLWVSGRAALQVLAGAAGGRTYEGRLLTAIAPYGVGYFAGSWLS